MPPNNFQKQAKNADKEDWLFWIIRAAASNVYKNAYRISGCRWVMQKSEDIITTERMLQKKIYSSDSFMPTKCTDFFSFS